MTQAIAKRDEGARILELVVIDGDLSKLSPADRVVYYRSVCESLGLNPLTKPFDYLWLRAGRGDDDEGGKKKLVLYARRDCADQLRKINGITVQIVAREKVEDLYVVTARATDQAGRSDESIGAVSIKGLSGEWLANAVMKAETKAKRRVTLSLNGLGWLDESEASAVPGARPAAVDPNTGEIVEASPPVSGQPTEREVSRPGPAGEANPSIEPSSGPRSTPGPAPSSTPPAPVPKAGVTRAKEVQELWVDHHGLPVQDFKPWLDSKYGVTTVRQLSDEEACEVIAALRKITTDALTREVAAAKAGQPT